jgi:hypothetical protein
MTVLLWRLLDEEKCIGSQLSQFEVNAQNATVEMLRTDVSFCIAEKSLAFFL